MTRGGRNLLILGVGSIAIAIITTGISLAIYHSSGDIYLDRSRPGFLPDKNEDASNQSNEVYKFSDTGSLDKNSLEEYLKNLQGEVDHIDQVKKPFDPSVLSDDALDITGKSNNAPADDKSDVNVDQNAQHIHD